MAHNSLPQPRKSLLQSLSTFSTSLWRFPEFRKRLFKIVWRQPLRIVTWLLIVAGIILGLVLVVKAILYGYSLNFTGFNEQPIPNPQKFQSEKTLWDWLQLLVIPTVLAVGGVVFNRLLDQRADDQQQEDAWQAYLDKMSELLTTKNLKKARPGSPVRDVACARTLAVLPGLDPIRKGRVLRFLYDSGLIWRHDPGKLDDHNPIVDLHGANFSDIKIHETRLDKRYLRATGVRIILRKADLQGAIFRDASLQQVDLSDACLDTAYISQADLNGTWFCRASMNGTRLIGSNLHGACLRKAQMKKANLQAAYLRGADLREADLEDADLRVANFQGAKLCNANMTKQQQEVATVSRAILQDCEDPDNLDHTCEEKPAFIPQAMD